MAGIQDIVWPTIRGGGVFDAYTKGKDQGEKEYDRQTLFEIGAKALKGDMTGAANTAFERGNVDAAFKVQDRVTSQADKARESEAKLAKNAAGIFQNFIDNDPDPTSKAAKTQSFISSHPELAPRLQRYGVNVKDPGAVSSFFQAQARGYVAPPTEAEKLDMEAKRATIEATRALALQRTAGNDTPQGRAAVAQQYGLDPNSDAGRSFILTGKLPREDQQSLTATDKKAILEADEMVAVNQGAIQALSEAEKLSPQAYDGALASQRAWLANNFSPWDTPQAEATANLDNAIVSNALTQLKAIFGGAPTEGERKVLLELQGSSNQPANVRADIYRRARLLAEKRLQFNRDRAAALRGGTFYKPQGAPGQQAPAPSLGGAPVRARNAAGETIEWNGSQWVPVQ